ncbi:MAG: nicotinate (nicotinamide) nucleotide adenylyltransferase [Endomicrobium sp.]|jgi:nicotinate-nucleotide adenylyltransferase|nr:nicotinate (nicotinamide) nucleotide adenylyltransferase [Endomicrobium sp.]
MSKVAIFGGSFDPVHRAHIRIAKLALESFDLRQLNFVIAYAPPHKIKQYACVEDRISMLKFAIEKLDKSEVSLYETQKRETVYSYQTLDYFQNLYPTDEICMIIGSDSLLSLPTWENIDYLASKYRFIVAKRSGIDIKKDTKYLNKCIFIDKEIENTSSTEVRKLIKEDLKKATLLLDEKVFNYISQKKIYQ